MKEMLLSTWFCAGKAETAQLPKQQKGIYINMSEIFEVFMVLSFGFAWPASILRSYRARTAKGKSLSFLIIINFGYICGIISKALIINNTGFIFSKHYVIFFYILNFIMVSIDLLLYFRNRRLDKLSENN